MIDAHRSGGAGERAVCRWCSILRIGRCGMMREVEEATVGPGAMVSIPQLFL